MIKTEYENGWTVEIGLGKRCSVTIVDPDGNELNSLSFPFGFWEKRNVRAQVRNFITETAHSFRKDYDSVIPLCRVSDSGELEIDEKSFIILMQKIREGAEAEEERKKNKAKRSGEPTVPEMDREWTKGEAMELLKNPAFLSEIRCVLTRGFMDAAENYRFIVGESRKKLFTYLTFLSAKTKYPQFEWIMGDTGSGKTNLASTISALFPGGYVKERGYITGAGLRYGDTDYDVLYVQEFRGQGEQDVRLISTEDRGFMVEVAKRDKESGEMTTELHEVPARVFVTTSAEQLPSDQLLRRTWVLSTNESKTLTKTVNRRIAEQAMGAVSSVKPERIDVLRMIPEFIEPKEVLVPYAEDLLEITDWDRTNYKRFLQLIRILATIHQHQREEKSGQIVAESGDAYMALEIGRKILGETLKVPRRFRRAFEVLWEMDEGRTSEVAERMGKPQSTVRSYLNDLVNLGYAYKERRGRANVYSPAKEQDEMTLPPVVTLDWSNCEKKVIEALNGNQRLDDNPGRHTYINPVTGERIYISPEGGLSCQRIEKEDEKPSDSEEKEDKVTTARSVTLDGTSEKEVVPVSELIDQRTEFEREIAQKLLWGGPMTIDEVRSELDIEDTQFNEAFNRLAERGMIVQRGGKWVHKENILGEP